MEFVTLSMGSKLPIVGSGTNTFGKADRNYMGEINDDTTELENAIALGYRHFDTAISYRNEAVVGKAIKESGLPRSNFFLTSKIPGKEEYTASEAAVRRGVEESLTALDTSYIDLYLIHHPWGDLAEILGVWRVLEEYVDQGILKEIGVSNFNEKELGYLLEHARIQPAVNQIESHPGKWNDGIISYSLENQVIPEAWGPLTRVSDEAQETLSAIGTNYNKTWAQIILRYQIERGVVVIPKSHNKERQALNLEIFDFELTEDERKIIASL
ncbi:aldo/keto reductase [Lederbergia sp. NSJ-179]|uniref:aldo/keto reductase family protein n=1 Tax=Lederbergia sp. NSJ-179 TaxID=2931402 RepID=UPI001FD38828|nr:aldo/keto reductase [Lederbergia sp. NSJ-179]MCJ7841910.1 aldo/keto reductase [Lederbergia sp. NSJ-179]